MAVLTDLRIYNTDGATLDPDLWGPNGVRGADKVAQRVMYALLTPIGSVPGRESFGSSFLQNIESFRSDYDVYVAFAGSEGEIAASVQSAESADEPNSEKFGSVRLADIRFNQTALMITLSVRALDGSSPTSAVVFDIDV